MTTRIHFLCCIFGAFTGCCINEPVFGFVLSPSVLLGSASRAPRSRTKQEATRNGRVALFSSNDGIWQPSTTSQGQARTYGLYEVQEQLLVDRGAYEETIMKDYVEPLQPHIPKGSGTAGGFMNAAKGKPMNSKSKKKTAASNTSPTQLQQVGRAHAHVLKRDGVVRIDHVLSKPAAEALRRWVFDHRDESIQLMEQGKIQSLDRFADVLLKSNRCDLTLPLGPAPVMDALFLVLCQSAVPDTLIAAFAPDGRGSKDATPGTPTSPVLYELSTLISDPGSQRQVVHPDNPIQYSRGLEAGSEPVLLTCFVALQDVQLDMGPTVWLPGTHTPEAHDQFFKDEAHKDQLLQLSSKVLGVLPQGCCALYDSRVLHCGTANRSKSSRALFYFSFRNPRVPYPGNPASIRRSIGAAQYGLPQLQRVLHEYKSSGNFFQLG